LTFPRSFVEISESLKSGDFSIYQLVENYLSVIENLNPSLNVFLEVFSEESKENAILIDQKLKEGKAGKLAGMVIGIKDLFNYSNHSVSCSSKILKGFESQITATSIQRLIDEDAIVIGRQNCDEFGMGSSNENSAYGPVRNFDNKKLVPGGSSGGSAVAVQAGMCTLSLASDTGGSIRQPAAFTDTIGLKPTYSRISRYGLTAYSSSFDCVGFIANEVEDIELALEICSGSDKLDSTCSDLPPFRPAKENPDSPKIAVLSDLVHAEGVSDEISHSFNEYLKSIPFAETNEIEFSYTDYLLPIYYILTSAEASTNLSRYDGVRYGYRANDYTDIASMYKKSRHNGFGKEVIRRILLGTFVLSANYHDAFYVKASKARMLVKNQLKSIFNTYDFIALPTTPSHPFELGTKTNDPVAMYLSDIFTTLASIGGFPAISLPVSFSNSEKKIGFQLISDEFEEGKLLKFSKQLKQL